MLSPEELQAIVETMYPLLDELNAWIIKDVVSRFMACMERGEALGFGATDLWQLQVYKEAAGHYEALEQELKKWLKLSDKEVQQIFEDAGLRAWNADDAFYVAQGFESLPLLRSENLMRILADTYQRTNGEIHNFTRTTARASEQRFMNVCDKAHLKVMTGAQSYTGAVKEAVEELSTQQAVVKYPSGHIDTIETAVLRCVRTGTAQASGNMSIQGMEERGWDVILVSAHLGARYGDGGENPGNHFWWQGKLYSLSGKDKELPPFEVCGYGTGEGLCGWNCRHSFGPGNKGHNPYDLHPIDEEENKKAYDLSQQQRKMERGIRKTKAELLGYRTAIENADSPEAKAELQEAYDKTALSLKQQNAAYNKFCEDNGLKRYDDRLQAAKWNRSEATRAAQAARRAEKGIAGAPRATRQTGIPESKAPVDVTKEYADSARPGEGTLSYEDGYDMGPKHADERNTAEWLHNTYGGNIALLKEPTKEGVRRADFLWRDHLWELKSPSTVKAVDSALRSSFGQIKENPGGIILNFKDYPFDYAVVEKIINSRMKRRPSGVVDLIIISGGKTFKILRFHKE